MLRTSATLAAFLLLASCSSAPDYPGSASPQDRQSITEAVRGGMTARHTAFTPVPPVCPGPVSATVREQLATQAPIVLDAYFTSPQLEREIEIATRVISDLARRHG